MSVFVSMLLTIATILSLIVGWHVVAVTVPSMFVLWYISAALQVVVTVAALAGTILRD